MPGFVALLSVVDILHAVLILGGTLLGLSLGATQGVWAGIKSLVLGFVAGDLAGLLLHLGDMIVWTVFWVPGIRRDQARRERIRRDYQIRLEAKRQ